MAITRIDWQKLLQDLAARGMSPVAVARELTRMLGEKVASSTPYRWLDGSQPLYPHGAAMLLLHTRVMAEAAEIRHSEQKPVDSRNPCAVPNAFDAAMTAATGREREEQSARLASIKARGTTFRRRR